jgi:homocysteine S-methyltransferase
MSIQDAIASPSPLILDGGLATELERRGHRLDDALWSARVLLDAPASIETVHYDFYAAGARCVTTASYQASYRGFAAAGIPHDEGAAILQRSVELANAARSRFISDQQATGLTPAPLYVAGSVGPFGATLHDGSEYRGDYRVSERALAEFHIPRLEALADAGVDIMACETIPQLVEARAIAQALAARSSVQAWVSFTSLDGVHTPAGDSLELCARTLDSNPNVIAVGVNCVSPEIVSSCLRELRRGTGKPLVAYPNVAGAWNAAVRQWSGPRPFANVLAAVPEWLSLGARAIGGCCGTSPEDIRALTTLARELRARAHLRGHIPPVQPQ